jgi:lipopolysaccharide transport system ATP-binding protein
MSSDLTPGAVSVRGLSKQYTVPTRAEPTTFAEAFVSGLRRSGPKSQSFWALQDISFEIEAGEAVAIIGANGAGKSTLLKLLSRITSPTTGEAFIGGTVSALLEVGTGFHPELTGRENVFLNGSILGMPRRSVMSAFDEIVDFAGVESFIDLPVKRYSSGMVMRLAFSVASCLTAPVLVIDEVLAVGDAAFQAKCLGRMNEAVGQGRTVLFVSHNMAAVRALCPRGILLERGQLVFDGAVDACLDRYLSSVTIAGRGVSAGIFDLSHDEGGGARPHLRQLRIGNAADSWSGQVAMGGTFLVQLDLDNWDAVRNVDVSISLWTSAGTLVTALMTQFSSVTAPVAHAVTYEVSVSETALIPGQYFLDVGVRHPGEADFDFVQRAGSMTVHEADFFGNGRLPKLGEGLVATQQRWRAWDRGLGESSA